LSSFREPCGPAGLFLGVRVRWLNYHNRVHRLATRLCHHIQENALFHPGDRVGVAVSGGADSLALLRLMVELREELGVVLSVVHFNHKIRGAEADADEQFVAELARQFSLELHSSSADTPAYAAAKRVSLETAARHLRYEYFERLITEGTVNKITTAHTLDDQAETVLLKLLRGAWTRGLAGIYPKLCIRDRAHSAAELPSPGQARAPVPTQNEARLALAAGAIVRPLLHIRRSELRGYLEKIGQSWREDRTNLDVQHTRNRVRHKLLPTLEKDFNPRVRELLTEIAEIAREEEEHWLAELCRIFPLVWSTAAEELGGSLKIDSLAQCSRALRRRLVRRAAESLGLRLEFRHVEDILKLAEASSSTSKEIVLNDEWRVLHQENELRFERRCSQASQQADYEYRLLVPGEVTVLEISSRFRAALSTAEKASQPGQLLSESLLPKSLTVRNWRPGDRFWPAHTKAPKKIKELLQDRKVPQTERRNWPVVVGGQEIVWVRGFPPPEHLLAANETGILIQELALQDRPHG
jgi:tRNA(Ile)-lysidine synthase